MTNNYEDLISSFEGKLQRLISEYESLKIQKISLEAELELERNRIKHVHKENLELQTENKQLRTARYLNTSPKERKISQQYVNKLVREIDSCLALLDE
jgi:predicted nuclease with TOPRIM domain